jgi:hypothetical protein
MICEISARFGREFCIACGVAGAIGKAAADVRVLIAFEEDTVGRSLGHRPMQMDIIADARCREIGDWLRQIQAWRLRRGNHAASGEEWQNGGQG